MLNAANNSVIFLIIYNINKWINNMQYLNFTNWVKLKQVSGSAGRKDSHIPKTKQEK